MFVSAILFLISAVGFAFSEEYSILILFRVLAGMGVGVASNVSPLYISEVAPSHKRGQLVVFYQLAITVGVLAAYISNFSFKSTQYHIPQLAKVCFIGCLLKMFGAECLLSA